jgi:2-dehydropantoate 2-reductase
VRICVLGAGGLGSVLGGWLSASGSDVTLVARPTHAAAIRRRGLRITGLRGEHTVTSLTVVEHPDEALGQFDLLVVAVKARATADALRDASSLHDRVGAVCSVQNTVTKDDQLVAWIGADRVIGASTIEGGTLVAPGEVAHTATAPTTAYFGELGGGSSTRVDAVVAEFTAAGFSTAAADDIRHVEWEKLLQISTVALWSASTFGALGGSFAQGLLVRSAAEHYVQLAQELIAVYTALGFEPADYYAPYSRFRELRAWTFEQAVDEMQALARAMVAQGRFGRPSLHDDLLHGRPTEFEFSAGTWLREADRIGFAVPTVRSAARIVESLEHWLVALGGVPSELPVSVVALGPA